MDTMGVTAVSYDEMKGRGFACTPLQFHGPKDLSSVDLV